MKKKMVGAVLFVAAVGMIRLIHKRRTHYMSLNR